jgi:hypothetical protein
MQAMNLLKTPEITLLRTPDGLSLFLLQVLYGILF